MVAQWMSLVTVALLLVNIVTVLGKDIPKPSPLCYNRFGSEVECGKTSGEKLLCPPMPRIDVYCEDEGVMHPSNTVVTKNCVDDIECPSDKKCCPDVCYSKNRSGLRNKICVPGRHNTHFNIPGPHGQLA